MGERGEKERVQNYWVAEKSRMQVYITGLLWRIGRDGEWE